MYMSTEGVYNVKIYTHTLGSKPEHVQTSMNFIIIIYVMIYLRDAVTLNPRSDKMMAQNPSAIDLPSPVFICTKKNHYHKYCKKGSLLFPYARTHINAM